MDNIISIILKDQNKIREEMSYATTKYHIELEKHKTAIKKITFLTILATLCSLISILIILWR